MKRYYFSRALLIFASKTPLLDMTGDSTPHRRPDVRKTGKRQRHGHAIRQVTNDAQRRQLERVYLGGCDVQGPRAAVAAVRARRVTRGKLRCAVTNQLRALEPCQRLRAHDCHLRVGRSEQPCWLWQHEGLGTNVFEMPR